MRNAMSSAVRLLLLPVAVASALCGCSFLEVDESEFHSNDPNAKPMYSQIYSRVDVHSAYPEIDRQHFEYVNLIELIDPSLSASKAYPDAWTAADKRHQWGVKYDLVLNWFRLSAVNTTTKQPMSAEEKRLTRNSVQERMMAASVSRCNVFKTYLQRKQSDFNFNLGLATTVAGVLGAIIPGVNASRNLAGTAGILSGTQSQFNQSYYSNLAANTVIRGIDSRQAAIQKQIRSFGQPKSIADYPMEAAISDALYFDGLCSAYVGLQEAENSIRLVANPGLAEAARTIATVKAINGIANSDLTTAKSQDEYKTLESLISSNSSPLAAPIAPASAPAASGPPDVISALDKLQSDTQAQIAATVDDVVADYTAITTKVGTSKPAKAADLPSPSVVQQQVAAALNAGIQARVDADVKQCAPVAVKLAGDLASARAALVADGSAGDRVGKQLAVDVANKGIETQELKFKSVSDLAALDAKALASAAKATWAGVDPTASTAYTDLQAKLTKVGGAGGGWPPSITWATPANLCK
jgi:hypothetical protein